MLNAPGALEVLEQLAHLVVHELENLVLDHPVPLLVCVSVPALEPCPLPGLGAGLETLAEFLLKLLESKLVEGLGGIVTGSLAVAAPALATHGVLGTGSKNLCAGNTDT